MPCTNILLDFQGWLRMLASTGLPNGVDGTQAVSPFKQNNQDAVGETVKKLSNKRTQTLPVSIVETAIREEDAKLGGVTRNSKKASETVKPQRSQSAVKVAVEETAQEQKVLSPR